MFKDKSLLSDFIKEMEHLQEAERLLQEVFLAIGPYGDGKIEDKLRWKINDFMGFDDSK